MSDLDYALQPVVDMVAVCANSPPTQQQRAALASVGFPGPGSPASHAEGDYWFFGGDAAAGPGTLGRCVLHVVEEGNPWISDAKAFVRYLNNNRRAFEEYATVKIEGATLAMVEGEEGNKLSEYKHRKNDVCVELMEQAKLHWAHDTAVAAAAVARARQSHGFGAIPRNS